MEEKNILDQILTLNFLELNKLILNLESKLNIDSTFSLTTNITSEDELKKEKLESDKRSFKLEVILTSIKPDKKISVLKTVKTLLNLDLKESKEIVDNLPKTLKDTVNEEEAKELKNTIEEAGGIVELKKI